MIPIDSSHYRLPNILTLAQARSIAQALRADGKAIGLCHGGFDLMHPGHMKHFESASKLCDVLFVSVTSDRFVTARKGDERPFYSAEIRAYTVAALRFVHSVVIVDHPGAEEIVRAIEPKYYIKGPDYKTKNTPGITHEREIIASVGGTMLYTDDEPFSTTKLVEHIRAAPGKQKVLLFVDRDGTLVHDEGFLGRHADWKEKLALNSPVVAALSAAQKYADVTTVVVTNQSGVARKLFTEELVRNINATIAALLEQQGVRVARWEYCPDVDEDYAKSKGLENFDGRYVKTRSDRKPSIAMALNALNALGRTFTDYSSVVMIGDKEDDRLFAQALGAQWIDVRENPDSVSSQLMEAIANTQRVTVGNPNAPSKQ